MDFEAAMLHIRTDNGVPIQRQIGLGCGQDRTSFLWRPVKHVSCALANHDMIFSVLMGIGFHLCPQSIDWPHRVGKHGVQRWQAGFVAVIVLLFVKQVQDAPDQQRLAGLLPVVPQAFSVRVNNAGGQILGIADFVFRATTDRKSVV